MSSETRTFTVGALTRVEGEGALRVTLTGDTVHSAELNIYEPPRFFEAFLRGRAYTEPPDITARVCGICPVAYQVSACNAIEEACGVSVDSELVALRRLLYCGEWIHSHVLHIYLLHAPDFLGYPDAISLAKDRREFVERGLALKKAGNRLMEQLGGRAIHPINVRLGGFYSVPSHDELKPLAEILRSAMDDALYTVQAVAEFDFPDFELDHELVALTGRIDMPSRTELFRAAPGLLSQQQNSPTTSSSRRCRTPRLGIIVRAVEVVYALEEALRIIAEYQRPPRPFVDVPARAGVGHGVSEAPRGLLYHRYEIDDDGLIRAATIIPPTSQNQAAIEHDMAQLVAANLSLDDATLTSLCERSIRN